MQRRGGASAGRDAKQFTAASTDTSICSGPPTVGSPSGGAASRTATGRGPTCDGPPGDSVVAALRQRLAGLFPVLEGVGVDQAWQGVLAVSRNWAPAVGLDPATGLAWAGGYVGEGVAAANLAGRTLRDLILGRDTELTHLPWVGEFGRPWEPEPLRFIGIHTVNSLLALADRREQKSVRPSMATHLARLISGQDL